MPLLPGRYKNNLDPDQMENNPFEAVVQELRDLERIIGRLLVGQEKAAAFIDNLVSNPQPGGPGTVFPADNLWDGGIGVILPDTFKFTEVWPFRDTSGVMEYPSAGVGPIIPIGYTFTDGTYAVDGGVSPPYSP